MATEPSILDTYECLAAQVYEESVAGLAGETTFAEGLGAALRRVLVMLAARPPAARLLFVEVLEGDRDLLAARERARARLAVLLAAEHARTEGSSRPPLHFDVLAGGLFRAISGYVADGRTEELPERVDDILAAAEVFEPAAA